MSENSFPRRRVPDTIGRYKWIQGGRKGFRGWTVVHAIGPYDVWAVGRYGDVVQRDGAAWSESGSGTPDNLMDVWGTGSDDVWAVGELCHILHWNGKAWTEVQSCLGPGDTLESIWGSGPDDRWGVRCSGQRLSNY